MEPRTFWQTIFERFDPQEPVKNAEWRVTRPYNPAEEILQELKRPFGDKQYLIYGTVGSGKSSELLWLAQQRATNDIVVFVDMERHFSEQVGDPDALQHIQSWGGALPHRSVELCNRPGSTWASMAGDIREGAGGRGAAVFAF